jgi:hypothetical protein
MALEAWSPDWLMAGLRVERRTDGGVHFDLVWRSRGQGQYVQPIASLMHSWSTLNDERQDYIEQVLLEAARSIITSMVTP